MGKITLKAIDPCWCIKSGRTYGACHQNRHLEKPLPSGQLDNLENKARKIQLCLHSSAAPGVYGGFIKAHTLQKGGPIKRIMDSGYNVSTFYDTKKLPDGSRVRRQVPWTQASTFYGFCDIHDGPLFRDLETQPFVGSVKQSFLVGYRAICHELYQKLLVLKVNGVRRDNLDRGKSESEQREIQKLLGAYELSVNVALSELQFLKASYDAAFIANDFSKLDYAVIFFDGDLSLASTGAVLPDYDVYGMLLQRISRLTVPAEGLAYGIVSTPTAGAVVFSWPSQFMKCNRFVRMLLKIKLIDLPSYIVEFVFKFVENTFFSEQWWQTLDATMEERLMQLACENIPHGELIRYSKMTFTNWQVTRIEKKIT